MIFLGPSVQRWDGVVGGEDHRVELTGTVRNRVVWTVNGAVVADKRTLLPRVCIDGGDAGTLQVTASTAAVTGSDLAAEPGSKAARREAEILHHPTRFAIGQMLVAIAVIVVPIVAIALVTQLMGLLSQAGLDVPGLPELPFSGFDLTDLGAPVWLQELLDSSDYVTPVALAAVVVWFELRRRRRRIRSADRRRPERGDT